MRAARRLAAAAVAASAVCAVPTGALRAQEAADTAAAPRDSVPEAALELPAIFAEVRQSLTDPGLARSVERLRPGEELVPFRDLGHWLSTRSSAVVRRYGGGGRQVLSLRGSRPEGVLVLLDGLPINDPLSGEADLSAVPLSSLESAILVRGAGAARYGSGALGGALVLRSVAAEDAETSGRLAMGSYGSWEAEASVAGSGLRFGAGLGGAENDYVYEDRLAHGTPERHRENADSESRWLHVAGRTGGHRLHLRHDHLERGVPGRLGTNAFDGDRWSRARWSLGTGTAGDLWTLRAGARHLDMLFEPGQAGEPNRQEAFDARLFGELALPEALDIVVAGRLSLERLSGDGILGTPDRFAAGLSIRRTFGAGSGRASGPGGGAPANGGFGAEPLLAVDVGAGEAAVSPELGAWYRIGGRHGESRVFGRIGRAYRLPTFADLHFEAAPGVRARPDLEAERVVLDAELGFAGARPVGPGTASLRFAAWSRDTRRPIVWVASSAAVWSPRNLDRLLARGVDLDLRFETNPASRVEADLAWAVEAGVSLQDSRVGFGSNRNPLPYQPDLAARLAAELRRGPAALRLGAVYTGSRTTSLAATRRLDGFVAVDVGLTRRFRAGGLVIDAALDVENLFDATYELVELFPEPGRTLRLTLDLH